MHFWRYSGFQLFVSKRFVMCPVSMITGRSRAKRRPKWSLAHGIFGLHMIESSRKP